MYSSRMIDPSGTSVTIEPTRRVRGQLRVPGDKSISHRYVLLAAVADGTSTVHNYAPGTDCAATLRCLQALGVNIQIVQSSPNEPSTIMVVGRGRQGLRASSSVVDAQNSGSTIRLLAGILAAHPFKTVITGDASRRRRPMGRIVEPLQQMGAQIDTVDGCPPMTISGTTLRGVSYAPPIASAQVKGSLLLAGLYASGTTRVTELTPTRDHTERAFSAFGVEVRREGCRVEVAGGQHPTATSLRVPGDLSSAAFLVAAAAALPGSELEIMNVGLNTTRTVFLDVLRAAGAHISVKVSGTAAGEPFGTINVRQGQLSPLQIDAGQVPGMIDELPALAAMACFGKGLRVSGAAELRAKESDRISVLATGLRSLGGTVDETPDGFHVHPATLTGGTVDAAGDHRMAMAFAIAALGATGPTTIMDRTAVDVSYPEFFTKLESICE